MLNSITLHGRLGRDPELRYTQQSQIPVASFSIAVDRNGKDAGTDWINIVAWNKTAELIDKYFRKGDEILISGRLQIRSYEDKNGNKRTVAEVVADRIDFCGKKSDRERTPEQPASPQPNDNSGFMEIPDSFQEELPFV